MIPRRAACFALPWVVAVCATLPAGCKREGCVGGDDGTCVPPSACSAVRYTCDAKAAAALRVDEFTEADVRSPGPKAMAALGDIVMENHLVRVVLDAPGHAHGLAPSGGSIIDFAPLASMDPRDQPGDQINGIFQAAGLLPRDAVRYTKYTKIEYGEADPASAYVSVVFRGALEGDPRVTVVTRYELHACEPGVRVRTDVHNGAPDPNTLYVTDGFFWGDNTLAPFVPGPGLGFRAPEIDLLEIDKAWREWPFMAARTQAPPDVAYASVPCDRGKAAGFNGTTLSAAGTPLVTTLPGDGISFERYLLATPGTGLASAVREALYIREQVHGEPKAVTVTGRVVAGNAVPINGSSGKAASLLFYEPGLGPDPDDPARRRPWSEAVVAGSDGRFSVTLPPDRSYRVQPYAFGRPAAPPTSFAVGRNDGNEIDIGDITMTASANLIATVITQPGLLEPLPDTYAELVLIPHSAPSGANPPSFYGLFPGCDPMLGPPHGGSPACNRALTSTGIFNLLIPPGQYWVYATRGPFSTLKRAQISIAAGGETRLRFLIESLPELLPQGALSGDFHVHGAGSFDSSLPDVDRVVSFLATGLDVVVATDHDVVTTYEQTLSELEVGSALIVIPGVEQTPNILWFAVPGEDFPKTLGHFNFWPLLPNPTQPRNGAPWDELREPGQMMDDIEALLDTVEDPTGVRQLNHPMIDTKFGRDLGFPRAINYDVRTPIVAGASFAADVLLRAPGGKHRNIDWDAQEVMSGASRADWLRHRALWFSLLNQGIVRAGTANSDTHTLSLEHAGYPRNLVFGNHRKDAFVVEAFDEAVRAGHAIGTNGPILVATITDTRGTPDDGDDRHLQPSLAPITSFVPANMVLTITVRAAPWIPLEEIRLYVNGKLAKVERIKNVEGNEDDLDPLGSNPRSVTATFTLSDVMFAGSVSGDAWLVVEAGMSQPDVGDADDDGLPDLPDASIPGRPPESDPRFHYHAIVPGGWPTAFTNPFLLDLDGNGVWKPPGL